jgi:hypothetical protein
VDELGLVPHTGVNVDALLEADEADGGADEMASFRLTAEPERLPQTKAGSAPGRALARKRVRVMMVSSVTPYSILKMTPFVQSQFRLPSIEDLLSDAPDVAGGDWRGSRRATMPAIDLLDNPADIGLGRIVALYHQSYLLSTIFTYIFGASFYEATM